MIVKWSAVQARTFSRRAVQFVQTALELFKQVAGSDRANPSHATQQVRGNERDARQPAQWRESDSDSSLSADCESSLSQKSLAAAPIRR